MLAMYRLVWLLPFWTLLLTAAPAEAKSFHYPSIDVQAQVRQDGSMHVREDRTFQFRGSFHEAWRKMPLPEGVRIENFALFGDGVRYTEDIRHVSGMYAVDHTARRFEVHWYYDIADRPATFALEYDVVGAVIKHPDIAELNWRFIEADRGARVDDARVTIRLPDGLATSEIRAWAHGPPQGHIDIAADRVTFTCAPLPDEYRLEGRILFPTSAMAGSTRETTIAALGRILAEEERLAAQANADRRRARVRLVWQWGTPAAAVVFAICLWLVLYLRYGREYHDETPVEYLRDPPEDWTPNEVAFLWRWGKLDAQDMTATLMDLVRHGALRLIVSTERREVLGGLLGETTEQDYVIERVPDKQPDLADSERYLVKRILFHEVTGDRISLETFQKKSRSKPRAAYARFKVWKGMAEREAKRFEIVDPQSKQMCGVVAVVGFLMFAGSIVLAGVTDSPAFMASGIFGFALMPASFAILRRTPEAARHLSRWQAFRRYLTDFSRLKEYPPPAVVLWEHYLVYAITLGIADRVIEQFRELYPRVEESMQGGVNAFPHWVSASGNPLGGMGSIGSVLSSFSSTLATATSSMSSSSGSGGGFSGGSSGGGGGGSSGAR